MSPSNAKIDLRRNLNQRRRALSIESQQLHANAIFERAKPYLTSAQNIASYLPADGEVDTTPIHLYAWAQQQQVAIPCVHGKELTLAAYQAETPMMNNQWDIPEPRPPLTQVPLEQLDLLFVPLLGFDAHCGRLGRGGGYYDRLLHPLLSQANRPRFIGLAHECQKIASVPIEAHDVHCDIIITERDLYLRNVK